MEMHIYPMTSKGQLKEQLCNKKQGHIEKYIICTAVLVSMHFVAWTQCIPSAPRWMTQIEQIEESEESITARIKKLEVLKANIENCHWSKDSIYARIIHRLGDFYRISGNYEKAISYTNESIRINKGNSVAVSKPYLAHSYFNLALYYNELYLFDKAHLYFDSSIRIAIHYPEKILLLIRAIHQKSFSFYKTGDYQKSIDVALSGLNFSRKQKSQEYTAFILFQLIQSQLELNLIDQAQKYMDEVLKIIQDPFISLECQALAYNVFGNFCSKKSQYEIAAQSFKKSFDLSVKEKNWPQASRDMLDLGNILDAKLGKYKEALNAYDKGIRILKNDKDAYQFSHLYIYEGKLNLKLKQYEKSLQLYQKGLLHLPINFKDTSIYQNPSIDDLKLITNDLVAYELFESKACTFLELYKAQKEVRHLSAALDCFKKACHMMDQMRWRQFNEQSKLHWRERTREMLQHALETCFQLNDPEEALFFFEKSRAMLLYDKLNEIGAKQYLSQKEVEQEQHLRIQIVSSQNQLTILEQDHPAYGGLREKALFAQDSLERFIKQLEKKYPLYYQYKYDNSAFTINDVRKQMELKTSTLVEYFTSKEFVYALVIAPHSSSIHKLLYKDYHYKAIKLMRMCSSKVKLNQEYGHYQTLSFEIFNNIFKPLNVKTPEVIISQDDQFIPFELLLKKSDDPTSFLLKDHAFSYTYSAACSMKDTISDLLSEQGILGVAPVNFNSNLKQQSLEGSDNSLNNIKEFFTAGTFLTKKNASKSKFLEEIPQYAVVQLYSHATADKDGKEPTLYLYDSALSLNELQILKRVKTKLMVLSACQTGLGKHVPGEGIFSLARGFAAAGIPSTITSLWEIDSQSTYEITELFYKFLSEGVESNQALQRAKLAFIASHDSEKELPYYWAANILIGKTHRLMPEGFLAKHTSFFKWFLLFLAICILIYLIYIKQYIRNINIENSPSIHLKRQ